MIRIKAKTGIVIYNFYRFVVFYYIIPTVGLVIGTFMHKDDSTLIAGFSKILGYINAKIVI